MRHFTDSAGRAWSITMNVAAAKRVKQSPLAVDLLHPEQDDPSPLQRVGTDIEFVCDLLYVILKPQADERGVTDVQFGEALGGDAVASAWKGLTEELADFFRQAGLTHLARALEKTRVTVQLGIARLDVEVEKMDPEKAVDQAMGEALTSSPGKPSTSSPASSG